MRTEFGGAVYQLRSFPPPSSALKGRTALRQAQGEPFGGHGARRRLGNLNRFGPIRACQGFPPAVALASCANGYRQGRTESADGLRRLRIGGRNARCLGRMECHHAGLAPRCGVRLRLLPSVSAGRSHRGSADGVALNTTRRATRPNSSARRPLAACSRPGDPHCRRG